MTDITQTEKRLREGLVRLITKSPTNIELKQKLRDNKLKIVVSNVEKEAGLSNGAAKRYPELIELIKKSEEERIFGMNNMSVEDTVLLTQPLYIKVKENLEKAKAENKKLKAELALKNGKLEEYKQLLKEQSVKMHQINVAMWGCIPDDRKHIELMRDLQSKSNQNKVIDFKRRD